MNKITDYKTHFFRNELTALLLSVTMFSQTFVYAILSIVGISTVLTNSGIYITIFILTVLFIGINVITNHQISKKGLWGFLVITLMVIHFLIYDHFSSDFWYFVMWGIVPTVFVICLNQQHFYNCIKYIEIINLIQSIVCIVIVFSFFISGNTIVNHLSYGGETYQTIAYVAATAVGLYLFFLFWGDEVNRFHIFYSTFIKICYVLLLILSVITTFLSGGRGGAILLIIYLLLFFILFNSKNNYISLKVKLFIDFLFVLGFIILIYIFINNDIILNSLKRTFSYITYNGLDFSQSSYRDSIYASAFNNWLAHPIIGYGPMNYPNGIYPHNLFLDYMLSGGIIYLLVGLLLFVKCVVKIINSFRQIGYVKFYSFIAISTFTMLMFSGTFFTNIRFWICCSFFLIIL